MHTLSRTMGLTVDQIFFILASLLMLCAVLVVSTVIMNRFAREE
ncbi:MAG: hypothetical protein R3F61_04050 [Myxococcota bacterium]